MLDLIEQSYVWQTPFWRGFVGGVMLLVVDLIKSADLREGEFGQVYVKNDKHSRLFLRAKLVLYPVLFALAVHFASGNDPYFSIPFFGALLVVAIASFIPFNLK